MQLPYVLTIFLFSKGASHLHPNFILHKVKTQVINKGKKNQQEKVQDSMKNKRYPPSSWDSWIPAGAQLPRNQVT